MSRFPRGSNTFFPNENLVNHVSRTLFRMKLSFLRAISNPSSVSSLKAHMCSLEHASKFFGVSIDDSATYSRAYRDG